MEKTLSETKEDLIRKTEVYKSTIEDQLNELKGDAAKVGKLALIAGGAIFVTYFIIKSIAKKKSEKRKKVVFIEGEKYALAAPKSESFIAKEIRRYMIFFLVALAKQKLAAYLQNLNTNTSNSEANPAQTPELQERWL